MHYSKAIGNSIKKYRTKKGLSQSQIAQLTNIPPASISDIELGKIKHIDIDNLIAIANALEIKLNSLFYDITEIYESDVDPDDTTYELVKLLRDMNKNQLLIFRTMLDIIKE